MEALPFSVATCCTRVMAVITGVEQGFGRRLPAKLLSIELESAWLRRTAARCGRVRWAEGARGTCFNSTLTR